MTVDSRKSSKLIKLSGNVLWLASSVAHLHASSFLYSPNQGLLLEHLLRGHRADDNVHLTHRLEQARVIFQ